MNPKINDQRTITLTASDIKTLEEYWAKRGTELPDKYKPGDRYTAPMWSILDIFEGEYG